MESPFRSEAAAFRFLLITIGAFALIVLASSIPPRSGFLTFLALSAGAVAVYLRSAGPRPTRARRALGGPTSGACSSSPTRRSAARSS